MAAEPKYSRYCATCERSYDASADHCPADGSPLVRLDAGDDELIGEVLDRRYSIVERLGQGGMGTVYRGMQLSVGREVAIKVVSRELMRSPDHVRRFLREAKLTSRLSHPNAVSVLDFGQSKDGLFYLVMEMLTGRTLDQILRDEGPLPVDRVLRIGVQICDALGAAQQMQIVHRDLKPSNVIVVDNGAVHDLVKVLDFGVAKSLVTETMTLTDPGAMVGTPAYMAPEVIAGTEVDTRSDLYAVGVILYQLASGRLPFTGTSLSAILSQVALGQGAAPESVGIAAPLARAITRLMAKDPAERPASAAQARELLEQAAANAPESVFAGLETLDEALPLAPQRRTVRLDHVAAEPAPAPRPRYDSYPIGAARNPPVPAPPAAVAPRPGRWLAIGAVVAVAAAIVVVIVLAAGGPSAAATPAPAPGEGTRPAGAGGAPTGATAIAAHREVIDTGGATHAGATPANPDAVAPPAVQGVLVIESSVAGSRIVLDGVVVAATAEHLELEVAPGEHHVRISAPGYRTATLVTSVKAGATATLRSHLVALRRPELPHPGANPPGTGKPHGSDLDAVPDPFAK